MATTHGCTSCEKQDPEVLKQIGEQEHESLDDGDRAVHTYFDCTACGSGWTQTQVRGATGRRTFWSPRR